MLIHLIILELPNLHLYSLRIQIPFLRTLSDQAGFCCFADGLVPETARRQKVLAAQMPGGMLGGIRAGFREEIMRNNWRAEGSGARMEHTSQFDVAHRKHATRLKGSAGRWAGMMLLVCLLGACQTTTNPPEALPRAGIHLEAGKVREPLKWRMVSFHKGKADKQLVKLASELGFNGVEIQIEGSTVDGIKGFAKYDAMEHLVDYCHSLGMAVTVWVHELSDVPQEWVPEWLGPVTVDNEAIWKLLDARYEWMLHDELPNIDGLTLTVVETQIRATDTAVLVKLTNLLREKTDKYHKRLIVRTFVWYPDEWDSVMAAIKQFPADQVVMTKCVPQDWNTRGIDAKEIGDVGGRPQIEEYEVCGEYFLRDQLANCMVDTLKRQFDYGLKHGVQGICVRVDRDDSTVLHQPNEVNLWALGMLASGVTDSTDEIWKAWAKNRFGAKGADGVIEALKPTPEVVSELLSIGPFSFGDTRAFPPLGDDSLFGQNWQTWWWDSSYTKAHEQAMVGDPEFIKQMVADKARADATAQVCLSNLELVRWQLAPEDYEILKTKLITNKRQLELRTPMELAVMHYRQLVYAENDQDRDAADKAMQADLTALRAAALPVYEAPTEITWLGRKWKVNEPDEVLPREQIYHWAYQMDQLRRGDDPRVTGTHPPVGKFDQPGN